jgi:hypothetical protein
MRRSVLMREAIDENEEKCCLRGFRDVRDSNK